MTTYLIASFLSCLKKSITSVGISEKIQQRTIHIVTTTRLHSLLKNANAHNATISATKNAYTSLLYD